MTVKENRTNVKGRKLEQSGGHGHRPPCFLTPMSAAWLLLEHQELIREDREGNDG